MFYWVFRLLGSAPQDNGGFKLDNMRDFYNICGDSVKLRDVRWVIVDHKYFGFPWPKCFRREIWTVELQYEDGEGLTWAFDNEGEARDVKADIDLHLL